MKYIPRYGGRFAFVPLEPDESIVVVMFAVLVAVFDAEL
jgi:hypothetical protein